MMLKFFKIQLWFHLLLFVVPLAALFILFLMWGNAFGVLNFTDVFEFFSESLFDFLIPILLTAITLFLWNKQKLKLAWLIHLVYLCYLVIYGVASCYVAAYCSIFPFTTSLLAIPVWMGTIFAVAVAIKTGYLLKNNTIDIELTHHQKNLYQGLVYLSPILLLATQIIIYIF